MSDKEKVSGEEVEVVATLILGGIFYGSCGHELCDNDIEPRGSVLDRLQSEIVDSADDVQLDLMTVAQHQRITDALRGEVSRIESEWKDLYADQMELVQERDQLRAEVELLKAQLAEEIQRRFDGNEISSNEHREEVQRLQAQLAQQQVLGWKLVPVEPTPEMVSAAEEAHMPFGDMYIALLMAILSAPSAPATVQGVNTQLLEALEEIAWSNDSTWQSDKAEAAIAAARQEGGKV